MAPEQAEGRVRELGPAVDVYGLGAILYELLAGQPPFLGAFPAATLYAVIHNDPLPPSQVAGRKVARDLETVCLKCLRKRPAERYRSAAGLADDLARFAAGEPVKARPPGLGRLAWRWMQRH